ncbi:MAG TPA: hypothetical protein VJQ56_02940 [Blastocatellia bacterium]|nr:hypothetical protein [Blastocatellia bacterium]
MDNEREGRLRRQIEELVRSRVSVLEQDISHLQREVNESFTRLLERTDSAAAMPESDELLSQIEADVTAQIGQAGAESIRLGADIALLRDSVVELDTQQTQAEVLNALVARAENFAPRIVLFVVKGQNALAWSARGFDDGVSNSSIRGLSISLQSDTALRAALNSQQTFYGSPDQQTENELIFTRFGNTNPQRLLAVPLKVRGKAAAILYADSADRGEEATNVEAIELLVHTAGLVVELVSLRARMGEGAQAAKPAATGSLATPGAPAAAPAQPAQPARPETAQTPAPPAPTQEPARPQETPQTAQPSPVHQAEPAQPTAAPAQPRPPEPEQPAEAAPPAAQPQTEQPQIQQPPSSPPPPSPQPQAAGAARNSSHEEEERLHNDARRFARLLVSEIKLYNESKVAEGRRNNDLYDRLKEDIDRSRQMYEKRVSPTVAAKFDYFYDELVNTLAEGDKGRLGSDFPGPSVQI